MFIICHFVLVNIMASRVYRGLKLGLDDEQAVESLLISMTNASQIGPQTQQASIVFRTSPRCESTRSLDNDGESERTSKAEKPCLGR